MPKFMFWHKNCFNTTLKGFMSHIIQLTTRCLLHHDILSIAILYLYYTGHADYDRIFMSSQKLCHALYFDLLNAAAHNV
jgi:hypothetical protein